MVTEKVGGAVVNGGRAAEAKYILVLAAAYANCNWSFAARWTMKLTVNGLPPLPWS